MKSKRTRLQWSHPKTSVTCLEFSPSGDLLAAGGGSLEADNTEIRLWRTKTVESDRNPDCVAN